MYKSIAEDYHQMIAPTVDDFLRKDITLADRARNTRTRRIVGMTGLALYALTMFSIGAPALARAETNQQTSEPTTIELSIIYDSNQGTDNNGLDNKLNDSIQDAKSKENARAPVPIYNSESGELLPVFGQQDPNGYLANETNGNSIDALAKPDQSGSQNPEKSFVEKLIKLEYALDDDVNQGNYGQAALKLIPNCVVKLSLGSVAGVAYPVKQAWDFRNDTKMYTDPEEERGHRWGRTMPHILVGAYIVNFFYNIWKHMTRKPWDFGANVACSVGLAAGLGAFDGGSNRSQPAPSPATPGAGGGAVGGAGGGGF